MKGNFKNIVYILIIIFLIGLGVFVSNYFNGKTLEKVKIELNKERIKNDTLIQLSPTLYKKLLADTLTKRKLKRLSDSLKLELENPKVVEVIKFLPAEVKEKEIEVIKIKDTIITTIDYYPKEEGYFIKHSSTINTKTSKGETDWAFSEQEVRLGIDQNKDGTYVVKTKVPEYLKITGIDVQSQPTEKEGQDNYGVILGAGYNKNLENKKEGIQASLGYRFNRVILLGNISTNNTLGVTINYQL